MAKSSPKSSRTGKIIGVMGRMVGQEMVGRLKSVRTKSELAVTRIKQAETLVKELSAMKGAAMKLGQMLALEAGEYLPDEVVQILERLKDQAQAMTPDQSEALIRGELKEKFASLSELSPMPIAAASIGQVHRARLAGKDVVLKVQYPEVRDSIDTDLKFLGRILRSGSVLLGKGEVNLDGIIEELSEVFRQETDYLTEAQLTLEYRNFAREIPEVVVPDVNLDFCTPRVLTLSFEEGIGITEAIRQRVLNQDERIYFSQIILKVFTYEFCRWGLVQTDPNLGNFLLRPRERKLVLLDFGAARRFSAEFRKQYAQMIMAATDGHKEEALLLSERLEMLHPKESPDARDIFFKLLQLSMQPFQNEHFNFSDDEYPTAMRNLTRKLISELKYSPPPRRLIFLHRKLGGIFQIIRKMGVSLNLRPYLEEFRRTAEGLNS